MEGQITIGIVTLPLTTSKIKHMKEKKLNENTNLSEKEFIPKVTYLSKQYKDWLKMVGIRVVPIVLNESNKVHKEQLSFLQGLLFTGGASDQFFCH